MMQTRSGQRTEILIRFSSTWWIYMFARGGILRALVNGIEDALAITGRNLLLLFLIYCGAKAGAFLASPNTVFPTWLEMAMFILQLAGLEGSLPGLARQTEALMAKQETKAAKKINEVMHSARVLMVASMAEGAFHSLHLWDEGTKYISAILLVVRGIVITGFLIELAKIDATGPRILSKSEFEKEQAIELQRGEQAHLITDLRAQLEQTQSSLATAQQQMQQTECEQRHMIQELRDQLVLLEQTSTATLANADVQTQVMIDLQKQLTNAERLAESLTTLLEQKRRECESAHATSQTAKTQHRDLQDTHDDTAKVQSASVSLPKTRVDEARNVTPIEHARAKHDAGHREKTQRLSHAEVLNYMAQHPDLKRAEVAAQLGISERKVYDALAWTKAQEHADASAH